ncbi:t-SNARE [Gaertneriomyces semiglobifer]|nr:t-SNARE [Gaertneriomyces semiglobifer]
MATRSRTLLFLQYRNSYSRTASRRPTRPLGVDTSERAGLIANEVDQNAGEVVVELSVLPPKWIDVVDEVDEEIDRIKARLTELEALHKKHLLPGFDDRRGDEQSMERLTNNIADMFRECERKVKRIADESQYGRSTSTSTQNQALARNIQVSLATKLQDLSSAFRKSQSSYVQMLIACKELQGRETRAKDPFAMEANQPVDDDDLDSVFTDAQMQVVQNNERAISQREKEIQDIANAMMNVADIFRELHTMVIDQGTVLDRIDYNIEQTNIHMQDAHRELTKVEYQPELLIALPMIT